MVAVCAATAAIAAISGCNTDDSADSSAPLVVPAATTAAQAEAFPGMTASEVLDEAKTAMRVAGAMTVDATGVDDGTDMHVKVAVTTVSRCAVAAEFGDESMQMVRPGGTGAYVKGNTEFWQDFAGDAGDAAADRLTGKWARLTSREYTGKGLDSFCSLDEVLDSLLPDGDAADLMAKRDRTTLDGRPVVPLTLSDRQGSMTVYVSTGVHPYVVKAETRDGSSRSSAVFTDVGLPPKVSAPPSSATVDAGDLGSDDGSGGFHV